jgi:hypothetical protein
LKTVRLRGLALFLAVVAHAYAECLRMRKDLAQIDSRDAQMQVELLLAHARLGQVEDTERVIASLMTNAGDDKQALFQIGCGYAVLGSSVDQRSARMRDKCFEVLNKLIDRGWRDGGAFDLDLDSIRGDKRYAGLLTRLKTQ